MDDEKKARDGVTLGRRSFLAAGLGTLGAGVLAACTGGSSGARPTVTASGSASATASTAAPGATATVAATTAPAAPSGAAVAAAALPRTTPWVARAGEVEPAVKGRAVALVEAVGAWKAAGGGTVAAARVRAAAAGFDPSLADSFTALLGAGDAAAVQVVDAQYGGILSSSSSVLVVVNHWRASSTGALTAGGTTYDIRLTEASPRWRVVAVHPAAPRGATSSPNADTRAVLADTRIRLPYAARADVASGLISTNVLSTLRALSDEHIVDVSVVKSGHPLDVFGTSRPSDHPKGHAVDVWALDGRPLVVPANHGLAVSGMRFAVAHGAYNVGGPVLLSGSEYFSDNTHQDHIHLGFRS